MKKRVIMYIGNALMLVAVILMVWKMIHLEIDYSLYFNASGILCIFLLSCLYGILLVVMSLSWRKTNSVITGNPIGFWISSKVYCKSNLLKYIPGNVFQYVGRNELAERLDLSHADVAMATGIDVFEQFFSFFIVSVIFGGYGFIQIIKEYAFLQVILPVGILAVLIIIWALFHFAGRKHKKKLDYYQSLLVRKNIPVFLKCIFRYVVIAIGFGTIYLLVITNIVTIHVPVSSYFEIFGVFILSWLFGFVTPGAPGGIGIREAVLTLLLGSRYDVTPFLTGIVIYRLINTLGDIIAYIITVLGEKIWRVKFWENTQ